MERTMRGLHQRMDYLFLGSQQLICCITFLLIKFAPVSNALPTNITNPALGNVHMGLIKPSGSYMSLHTSETAKFHIEPSKVAQTTQTNLNLIAAFTEEAPMATKSSTNHQHHRHQHKYRHLTHSLKGSGEHQWRHSTKFTIEPTPTQVHTTQTKASHFGDTNSIITTFPTDIILTEVFSDFPKQTTSLSTQNSGSTSGTGMTSTSLKDLKISKTATGTGMRASISPVIHPQTYSQSSTPQQTPTTNPATPRFVLPDNLTSNQLIQDVTTSQSSILQTSQSTVKNLYSETTFKIMNNPFANLTAKSGGLDTNYQRGVNKSLFNRNRNAILNEAMINETITSEYIRPTPILLMPHLNTKYNPSHFTDPSKESTQRPARNILSLNRRGQSKRKNSKDLSPSRSGLLHLKENDPPTSFAYKPRISHKKDFTSLPKNGNGIVLAAVTTEFMKSSEVIPDLFVTPTKSQRIHSTKSSHESQGGHGPSSVTAALSFKSKEEHMILSATATLSPSRMTYTCTVSCSQPGCMCCQDQQLAPGIATTAITKRPPSNTTPNIQVSTDKSLAEQISLSAGFGIGMGCLIAIWLVVGPVVCLICRIRDQVKESEGNLEEIEKRKKKQKEKSTGSKKDHPLTETIVMDELSKQFTKKKNSRENEYLLLAKDKAELECLSRVELPKAITNKKTMSTFDRTRSPHCLNKWDESEIEDDSDEEDEEKGRFSPESNTPTVSV